MTEKICRKCGDVLNVGDNWYESSEKGCDYICVECVRKYKQEYRKVNREIITQKKREYYKKNREIISQKKREYYEKNHDHNPSKNKDCINKVKHTKLNNSLFQTSHYFFNFFEYFT